MLSPVLRVPSAVALSSKKTTVLHEIKCGLLTEAHQCLCVVEDETTKEVLCALHQSHPRSGRFCTAHTGDDINVLPAHIQL